ncbi:MAG: hypothetical protein JWM10_5326 [Myxococcaceae bacterium]|nr:hypothetical protein [Myxococcaceae bacterium]
MRTITERLAATAILASLVGCEQPRTELVVRVETDLPWGVGQAVQSVRLIVNRSGFLDDRVTPLEAGRVELPLFVGVTPVAHYDGHVFLAALACAAVSGCDESSALVVQRAEVPFVAGRTLVVPILLARACVPGRCARDQRCTAAGLCESSYLAPETLRPYGAPDVDAGGRVDVAAATDGGAIDASADVGCQNSLCGVGERCEGGACVAVDGGADATADSGTRPDVWRLARAYEACAPIGSNCGGGLTCTALTAGATRGVCSLRCDPDLGVRGTCPIACRNADPTCTIGNEFCGRDNSGAGTCVRGCFPNSEDMCNAGAACATVDGSRACVPQ